MKATNTSVDIVDKHSIHCIACFDIHVDSVDKPFNDIYVKTVDTNKIPYSIHYSIAFDLLYRPSQHALYCNVHSNYNIHSNTKTLNYSKVQFKALIYFGLEQTSD